ncbi:MAG: hypothetical protein HWE16_05605 [Gammaproteobacteria bacterium]|nr:hypothetical protein [Gammaproteobacteria bacterium]
MSSFFHELKRRNVFRVAVAYAVIGWLLLQVADILTPALHLPEWIVSAITLILILGFIPVMLFSWAYEITPEGIKKEKEVVRSESITNETAKKLDIITLIAVMGLAGLIIWQQFQPEKSTPLEVSQATTKTPETKSQAEAIPLHPQENSIAVLPFADMSPDSDQEYFADGISEEILNALVKATGLRVAGRTSSFSFKGKDATIKDIGEALNVNHVLEGSVRKHNNSVRITVQLIQADNGFHLWSETYNGSLDNIFELQDQISRQVTEQLKVVLNLGSDERLASKMTNNIDAYDFYLRGREKVAKRINGNLEAGVLLLQQAVELDPNFAEAWAVLAEAEIISHGYLHQTAEEAVAATERAITYARNSIALNEKLALPYAILGLANYDDGKVVQGINEMNQALINEPNNPLILRWLAVIYSGLGKIELAMPLFEKAYEIDPLSTINTFNMGANHFRQENIEEALHFFMLTGNLRNFDMPEISDIYEYIGETEKARDWSRKSIDKMVKQRGHVEFVSREDMELMTLAQYGGSEEQKQAARELGTVFLKEGDDIRPWQLPIHINIGNIDRAFDILENKPSLFATFASDYMWQPTSGVKKFRSHPRFIELVKKHKFPLAWQQIGWPKECQPKVGTDGSNGQFQCE